MARQKLIKLTDAEYTVNDSTKTITLSSTYSSVTTTDLGYIYNKTQDQLYFGQAERIALASITAGVITIDSGFDNLATGDEVHIQLWVEDETLIDGVDSIRTTESNPVWNRYTDAESLVSASDIGASDDTWVDQGSEIDCRGYKTLAIFVVLTVNDSTGNQLQILPKIELAGSDEYTLETSADYQKTIGDSDLKVVYTFNVEGIPFVQLQTKATDVDTGGGVEGTVSIDIVKEY